MELDKCFTTGISVIEETYGEFEEKPEEYEEERLSSDKYGKTASVIDAKKKDGEIVVTSPDAEPHRIIIDEEIVNNSPKGACNTLLHELLEWRAAEELHASQVMESETDTVASFNESHICREVNNKHDENVCDTEWNRKFDT